MMLNLLEIKNLSVTFKASTGNVRAVKNINLTIHPGEIVGLVGESGSGKSVTSLAVMGLLNPGQNVSVEGQVLFNNRNLIAMKREEVENLRGNQMSMIFQDPVDSLNPVMRIGDQVAEAFLIHEKLTKKQAWDKAVTQLAKVKIKQPEDIARYYPYQLSGGMCQRVMIAIALSANPSLLIADEPTTNLDVTIQAQILKLLKTLHEETNTSILMVTHDLGIVSQFCQRIAVMLHGNIVEMADTRDLFANPQHPYTRGLLNSVPVIGKHERLKPIPFEELITEQEGNMCDFYQRCSSRLNVCSLNQPVLKETFQNHYVACYLK